MSNTVSFLIKAGIIVSTFLFLFSLSGCHKSQTPDSSKDDKGKGIIVYQKEVAGIEDTETGSAQKPRKNVGDDRIDYRKFIIADDKKDMADPKTDYQRDIKGRTEFSRSYLGSSVRLVIPILKYDETLDYGSSDAVWNAGFTVKAFKAIQNQNIQYFVSRVSGQGDLTKDRRYYDKDGKRSSFTKDKEQRKKADDINKNQTIQGLILFTTPDEKVAGYVKLPPVHIEIEEQ